MSIFIILHNLDICKLIVIIVEILFHFACQWYTYLNSYTNNSIIICIFV